MNFSYISIGERIGARKRIGGMTCIAMCEYFSAKAQRNARVDRSMRALKFWKRTKLARKKNTWLRKRFASQRLNPARAP